MSQKTLFLPLHEEISTQWSSYINHQCESSRKSRTSMIGRLVRHFASFSKVAPSWDGVVGHFELEAAGKRFLPACVYCFFRLEFYYPEFNKFNWKKWIFICKRASNLFQLINTHGTMSTRKTRRGRLIYRTVFTRNFLVQACIWWLRYSLGGICRNMAAVLAE